MTRYLIVADCVIADVMLTRYRAKGAWLNTPAGAEELNLPEATTAVKVLEAEQEKALREHPGENDIYVFRMAEVA